MSGRPLLCRYPTAVVVVVFDFFCPWRACEFLNSTAVVVVVFDFLPVTCLRISVLRVDRSWSSRHLDHLTPHPPLWGVVQDLHSTDPTRTTRPRWCRLCGSHPAAWARSYKIGNTSALLDLDQGMGINHLSELWKCYRLPRRPSPIALEVSFPTQPYQYVCF